MNSMFSVDTFFVVSSTFSSYLAFKDIETKGLGFILSISTNALFVAFKLFVHLSEHMLLQTFSAGSL